MLTVARGAGTSKPFVVLSGGHRVHRSDLKSKSQTSLSSAPLPTRPLKSSGPSPPKTTSRPMYSAIPKPARPFAGCADRFFGGACFGGKAATP